MLHPWKVKDLGTRTPSWVLLADDDTFIQVDALLDFIARYEPSVPALFGYILSDAHVLGYDYPCGGAGMFTVCRSLWCLGIKALRRVFTVPTVGVQRLDAWLLCSLSRGSSDSPSWHALCSRCEQGHAAGGELVGHPEGCSGAQVDRLPKFHGFGGNSGYVERSTPSVVATSLPLSSSFIRSQWSHTIGFSPFLLVGTGLWWCGEGMSWPCAKSSSGWSAAFGVSALRWRPSGGWIS